MLGADLLQRLSGPRVDREHDRHVAGERRQFPHRLRQQLPVDEGRAVQGDQRETSRLEPKASAVPAERNRPSSSDQGVDHRVADEVDPLFRDALAAQVPDRLLGMQEEVGKNGRRRSG